MTEIRLALIKEVRITEETLTVELSDGRTVSVPLAWYPRLIYGTPEERDHWRLIGEGQGIHWVDLDEDIAKIIGFPGSTLKSYRSGPALQR
jgi:hypothetical protein